MCLTNPGQFVDVVDQSYRVPRAGIAGVQDHEREFEELMASVVG